MPTLIQEKGPQAVIGVKWGDEGKGGKIDYLAEDAKIVARYAGGDNAGHSVTAEGRELKLHLIPSGILHPNVISVIGSEVVVNPLTLVNEIKQLQENGIDVDPSRFLIDKNAQLILPWHKMRDNLQEAARGGGKIGTTGRGIGPAYSDRAARVGLLVGNLLQSDFEERFIKELAIQEKIIRQMQGEPLVGELMEFLKGDETQQELLELFQRAITKQPFDKEQLLEQLNAARDIIRPLIGNTLPLVSSAVDQRRKVLFEGAQGVLLDLTFATHPFKTSSHPGVAGIGVGFGIHRDQLSFVLGVVKAFDSRVGEGPMPTELFEKEAERLRGTGSNSWDEFGTTTGRPRRVGWFDVPLAKFGIRIGGATSLAVTKMDILAGLDKVPICIGYQVGETLYKEPPSMDFEFLNVAKPIYEYQPGWEMPKDGVRVPEDIPQNAMKYLKRIEELTGRSVRLVSFGADRSNNILFS